MATVLNSTDEEHLNSAGLRKVTIFVSISIGFRCSDHFMRTKTVQVLKGRLTGNDKNLSLNSGSFIH